jgi:PAS domain S-box-containing protein
MNDDHVLGRPTNVEDSPVVEERLRQILASVPALIYWLQPGSERFWVNAGADRLLGYELPGGIGTLGWWFERVHPDDGPAFEDWQARLATHGTLVFEYRFRHRDGSYRWLRDEMRGVVDETGRLVDIFGSIVDVTERRAVDEALHSSEARYRELFETTAVALFRTAADGRILAANAALKRLMGIEPGQPLTGTSVLQFYVHPRDRARFLAIIERDGEVRDLEQPFRKPDGTRVWGRLTARAVRDGAGRTLYYDGCIEDVTERRRAAEELARQREALYKNEKMAELGRLAAGVAHELKNPLTVVHARVEMLQAHVASETLTPATLARHLDRLMEAATRMRAIVQGLSTYGKPQPTCPTPVEVAGVIRGIRELTVYAARQAGVEVAVAVEEAAVSILVDRSQMTQILLNLTNNAIEAMAGRGGRVVLRAGLSPGEAATVVIEVTDTGPGMDAETLARIWDPFYTTKADGTGLGLPIVRTLVQQQPGGTIEVESHVGRGTTFRLSFPLADESRDEPSFAPVPARRNPTT